MGTTKFKGLFIERDAFSLRCGEVSSLVPPLQIHALHEHGGGDFGQLWELEALQKRKSRQRYVHAHCAVCPASRFFHLHKATNLGKAREAGYWESVLRQARLDPDKMTFAVMDASTGLPFRQLTMSSGSRELIICGALREEMIGAQGSLVAQNIVPESLQLSGLTTVGGLLDYLRMKEISAPVLFLEMTGREAYLFIVSHNKVVLCRPIAFGYESVLPLICSELGLKDVEAARQLFFSNTFDFRDIGGLLFGRLLKELNAASGFYEMRTGQPLHGFVMTGIPPGLQWIGSVVAEGMEIRSLEMDWNAWLGRHQIRLGEGVPIHDMGMNHLPLISLMLHFSGKTDED